MNRAVSRQLSRMALQLVVCIFAIAAASQVTFAQLSMLHTNGRNIVNASGQTVVLKGVNVGGLMVIEQWMTLYPSS